MTRFGFSSVIHLLIPSAFVLAIPGGSLFAQPQIVSGGPIHQARPIQPRGAIVSAGPIHGAGAVVKCDPCADLDNIADGLRTEFRTVSGKLAALRRDPTAPNYAAAEQQLVAKANDLQLRWSNLQQECDLQGEITGSRPIVRGPRRNPDQEAAERERQLQRDLARDAENNRRANDLEYTANQTEYVSVLAEFVWSIAGDWLPPVVQPALDQADAYIFGIREDNRQTEDYFRRIANAYRNVGGDDATQFGQPMKSVLKSSKVEGGK